MIFSAFRAMGHTIFRMQAGEPNFSVSPKRHLGWDSSAYGHVKELSTIKDALEPLGEFITLSHYVSANLYRDLVAGCSVTDILKIPIDWYSMKQATVQTANHGYESLRNHHSALSFHSVREVFTSRMIGYSYLPGEYNPVNTLSRHWSYLQIRSYMKDVLFWKSDAPALFNGT